MMRASDCFTEETETVSDSAFVSGKHHVTNRAPSLGRINLFLQRLLVHMRLIVSLPRPPHEKSGRHTTIWDLPEH